MLDVSLLSSAKEIGIALTVVVGSGFLIKYIIDKNKEVFDALIEQLKENRIDYSDFVESNNHQNSDRIEKNTETMIKIAGAIEIHTQAVERLIDRLNK